VRECDPKGETVWEYKVPLFDKQPKGGHGVDAFGNQCFSALRLKSGKHAHHNREWAQRARSHA